MSFGFLMPRYVSSEHTNKFWIECYKCIRKFYPNNTIMIVDNGSDKNFLKYDFILENCIVIHSEFLQKGEMAAYYYFHKYRLFDKAVLIHDSMFIHKYVNFDDIKDIKFLWYFTHEPDNPVYEKNMISVLKDADKIINFYDNQKHLWYGCFGSQSVITLDFLDRLVEKYNLFELFKVLNCKLDRMHLESVFGVLCCYESDELKRKALSRVDFAVFDRITVRKTTPQWGYTYDEYMRDKDTGILDDFPFVKTWNYR